MSRGERAAAAASAGRRLLKSAERRRRVLLAAGRCFGRHGFTRATVQLIAREAGVSKGLVFVFFGDKEALYDAVIKHTLTTWSGFAEQQAARHQDRPDEELASLFRGSFEFAAHSPMLRVLMARRDREHQVQGTGLPSVDRAWRARIVETLRRGVERGLFRADLDCRRTAVVIHDVQHFYLDQMLGVEQGPYDAATMETALRMLLRSLRPDRIARRRVAGGVSRAHGRPGTHQR
jgi:AcrR family transcriptional regulator